MSKAKFTPRRKTPPENPNSPWIESKCRGCNHSFWMMPSLFGKVFCCNAACTKLYRSTLKELVKCKNCSMEKMFYKCEAREFCSNRCSKRFTSGSRHPRWVSARVGLCLHCRKEYSRYVVRPSGAATGRQNYSERKFCSAECRLLYRRENPYPRDAKIGDAFAWNDGYAYEKVFGRGWVPQHRYTMEIMLGRKLLSSEEVHHKNGNKRDNAPENLQLLSKSEHRKLHSRAEKIALILMTSSKWANVLEEIELEYVSSTAAYIKSGIA